MFLSIFYCSNAHNRENKMRMACEWIVDYVENSG